MAGVPSPLPEPVEDDRTRASNESEKPGKNENDGVTAPLTDIYSEEYPDGGARAWFVVFGVSESI